MSSGLARQSLRPMTSLPIDNPLFIAVAIFAGLTIGLSKGGLPVIAMLSVPLLSQFISPVTAAAVTLPIYVISDMYGVYLYRHEYSRRNLAILIPASLAGVGIGWATFSITSDRAVVLIIGTLGLIYCLNAFFKRNRPVKPRPADVPRGVVFGIMSGFTSFIAHAGAPPFQMYVLPQRLQKMVFAGTATILFAVVNSSKLVPYWWLGQFTPNILIFGLMMIPAALLGTFAGSKLVRVIPQDLFFKLVQVALFVLSLKLVYDGTFG
jgi:uncharacterized membrane protein YfcA